MCKLTRPQVPQKGNKLTEKSRINPALFCLALYTFLTRFLQTIVFLMCSNMIAHARQRHLLCGFLMFAKRNKMV